MLAFLGQKEACSEYEQSNHLGNVLNTVTDHLIRDYNLLANEDMAEQDPFTLNTRYMTASKALSAGALVVSASTSTATAALGGLQLPGNPIQTPTTPYQVTAPKSTLSYALPIQAQEKYSVNFDLTVNGNPLNQVAINVEINGVQIATTTHTGANGNKELVFTANNTGTATVRIEMFPLHQVGLNNATQTVTYTIGQTGTYTIDNLIIKEYLKGGFAADVQDANLYYPFGSIQPGRQSSTGDDYRYGFNGMEKDDEVKGNGNSYDFGARIYDPRLGRWLSVDPLAAKYPSLSPYNFAGNSPILFVDPDGRVIRIYYLDDNGEEQSYDYQSGITLPNNDFVKKTVYVLNELQKRGADVLGIISDLSTDPRIVDVRMSKIGEREETTGESSPKWNPYNAYESATGERQSAAMGLLHELSHVYIEWNPIETIGKEKPKLEDYVTTNMGSEEQSIAKDKYNNDVIDYINWKEDDDQYGDKEHRFIIEQVENPAAEVLGEDKRSHNEFGRNFESKGPFSTEEIEK